LPDSLENSIESTVDVKQWTFARAYKTSKIDETLIGIETQLNSVDIVYITKYGKKYHKEGCRSLRSSAIPISVKDAKVKGYGPCKVCNPPQ